MRVPVDKGGNGLNISFWVDPICPWCWVTHRWVADDVAPRRDLDVSWEPISLFFKNNPEPGGDSYRKRWRTHRLLRIMESVRADRGNDGFFRAYRALGAKTQHERDLEFDPAPVLEAAGLDPAHAAAYEDESWDAEIRRRMDIGLELVGQDVGTPIIALDDSEGKRAGFFGPVITRVPREEDSLRLWDAVVMAASVPGFWELKRTRTEDPDLGSPPSPDELR